MKRVNFFTAIVLGAFLTFTGFQCSSTDLTSAKLYIQQKNWDKAIEALNKEVAKNPKSDEGAFLLGTVYAEKEDMDKMIESYDKSLTISKKYEKEINNARKYHWANFFNRGVAFFNRAAAQQANRDSSIVLYNKSVLAFEQSLKLQPDSLEAHNTIAFVYMNLQKYDDAIPHFMKLIEKKKLLDAYKYLGQIYYQKGMVEIKKFEESMVKSDSLNALKYYDKSIDILEDGKKIYPTNIDILTNLANSYIAANKMNTALGVFKSMVDKEPFNPLFRYNFGVLLLQNEDFENATKEFLAAIYNAKINGKSENEIVDRFGQPDKKMEAQYENVNTLLFVYENFNLNIYFESGKAKGYQKISEGVSNSSLILGDYQSAIYNLAVTYVKWGAKIAKDYEIANKGNKDAKEETQSKEKYKAALPYLESYVQKKTDDAQIWELLGKVYTVMGMPNDASNAFKKADAIRKGN